jgi:hypothetical protein
MADKHDAASLSLPGRGGGEFPEPDPGRLAILDQMARPDADDMPLDRLIADAHSGAEEAQVDIEASVVTDPAARAAGVQEPAGIASPASPGSGMGILDRGGGAAAPQIDPGTGAGITPTASGTGISWAAVAGGVAAAAAGAAALVRGKEQGASPASPEPPMPPACQIDWYYVGDGQTVGPVPEEQLRQWLAEGRLPPETQVWNASMTDWQGAREAGLLPVQPPAIAEGGSCAGCGEPLRQGALFCSICGMPIVGGEKPHGTLCPACGAALAPDARFCAACGRQNQ